MDMMSLRCLQHKPSLAEDTVLGINGYGKHGPSSSHLRTEPPSQHLEAGIDSMKKYYPCTIVPECHAR